MINRRDLLSGAAAAAATVAAPEKGAAFVPNGTANRLVTWSRVVLNGGGFDMGFSIANDGTKVMRTDISGCYKWTGSIWQQMSSEYTNLSYPEFGGYRGLYGIPAAEIAPSDSNRIYQMVIDSFFNNRTGGAYIYKSTNGGSTFSVTNYPVNNVIDSSGLLILNGANNTYKRISHKIAVDPINPDFVYATNPGGLPLVTFDGGTTWSAVPDLPSGTTTVSASSATQNTNGSGGTNGAQTVTLSGGTFTTAAQFHVTITGEAISAVGSVATAGSYSAVPTNPVTVTGAGLSGASLNVAFLSSTIGACCWTFDPSGGSTGGKTNNIYVAIKGSGVWASTDAGASFSQISASVGVSDPQYSAISADGVFYICNAPGGNFSLDRYVSAAAAVASGLSPGWTTGLITIAGGPGRSVSIAAHPTSPGVIVGIRTSNHSPHLYYSSNYGSMFTPISKASETYTVPDAVWWANQMSGFDMASAGMLFDPSSPNDLYACLGQGMGVTTLTGSPPAFPGTIAWTGFTTGIENVVCDDLIQESGTILLNVVADLVGFVRPTNTLSTAPSNPIFGPFIRGSGWSGAIDPQNTQNMVLAADRNVAGQMFCGYSRDGGTTWTPFATNPESEIGAVVPGEIIINNGVILWLSDVAASRTSAQKCYWSRSTDWGTTWARVSVSPNNIPTVGWTGWGSPLAATPSHTGCADRVDPNKFYIYNALFGNTPNIKGVYVSTDGGQHFTYQGSGSDPFSFGITMRSIKCVPGQNGYLFAATGSNAGAAHPVPNNPFKKSTNGGAKWTAIANMLEVNAFAFGKAGPSGSPTLFVAGFYKNSYGIYMSEDLGGHFIKLVSTNFNTWPRTNDAVQCMEGDKDKFGRCYVGFRGSGTTYSTLLS